MFKVNIDGKEISVEPESTILEAANRVGVWIPTLCHSPAVTNPATCRICMVEIDRGGWFQMVTACNYPIRKDLTVRVSSERAVKARQGVMKLLLARAEDSEELKAMALRMGVTETPFPKVTEAQRNCILCGLCVRVCEEVIGSSAIGFAGRGVERAVATPFRLASDQCIACGACAYVCPVGTIQVRIHEDTQEAEISPFKSRVKLRTCSKCGTPLVSEPVDDRVWKNLTFHLKDFRLRSGLCPECRRKHTIGLAFGYQRSAVSN